jgi:hypothetical protein
MIAIAIASWSALARPSRRSDCRRMSAALKIARRHVRGAA